MAKGAAINYMYDTTQPYNASFRLIINYETKIDAVMMRFDFKIKDKQYNVALPSSLNIEPPNISYPIRATDDLLSPKNVESCVNVRVNLQQLRNAFAELVADMDKELKEMKGD